MMLKTASQHSGYARKWALCTGTRTAFPHSFVPNLSRRKWKFRYWVFSPLRFVLSTEIPKYKERLAREWPLKEMLLSASSRAQFFTVWYRRRPSDVSIQVHIFECSLFNLYIILGFCARHRSQIQIFTIMWRDTSRVPFPSNQRCCRRQGLVRKWRDNCCGNAWPLF